MELCVEVGELVFPLADHPDLPVRERPGRHVMEIRQYAAPAHPHPTSRPRQQQSAPRDVLTWNVLPCGCCPSGCSRFNTNGSRNTDPIESLVISVTKLNAAQAYNVIPDHVEIAGTVRTLASGLRDFAEQRIWRPPRALRADLARKSSSSTVDSSQSPSTTRGDQSGDHRGAEFRGARLRGRQVRTSMGAEDFACMLEARPGAYISFVMDRPLKL